MHASKNVWTVNNLMYIMKQGYFVQNHFSISKYGGMK